jgi:hypothetical protein
MRYVLLLLLVLAPLTTHAQHVQGVVRDAATGDPIAAATIQAIGTRLGTITNPSGVFSINLNAQSTRLLVRSLGYLPDTVSIAPDRTDVLEIRLTPSPIILPEVSATTEDPAIGIMRKAIDRKKQWIDRLATYRMDAFTRQILRIDTAIGSITESMSKGYWRAGDTLREVIVQKRQTENIKQQFNFASVGTILNFNEDRIRFAGYIFEGPTAEDAFDYYDFKLISTRGTRERPVYDIRMIPLRRTTPLFTGSVSIEGDSYALVGIDVSPNEAFGLPFVRNWNIRYRQQFSQVDSSYWMPVDIRIDARFVVKVPMVSFPPFGFSQTSVLSSYAVNVPLPDSLFHRRRLTVDTSSARFDSTAWQQAAVLPLTTEEMTAYRTLDSTKTLESQLKPGGIGGGLLSGDGGTSALNYADIAFNRVEGFHLGVRGRIDSLSRYAQLRGGFAYGFSSKKTTWNAGGTVFSDPGRTFGLGFDYEAEYHRTPGWNSYESLFNTLNALLAKADYYDYFRSEGWRTAATFVPSDIFRATLTYNHELHTDAPKTTDFSILYPSRAYRDNFPADPGRLRSVGAEVRIGRDDLPIDILTTNAAGFSVEHADPSVFGGDFSFTQVNAYGTIAVPTFTQRFLYSPQLRLRASGGFSAGTLPHQRYFAVETSVGSAAAFGAMRAMTGREFRGTSYAAFSLEHNFRSLPFLWLGIPFLYENNIELVLTSGAANAWGGTGLPARPDGWYYEAGFGISRLFELLRMDFTWRLSSPGGFMWTVGFANLM